MPFSEDNPLDYRDFAKFQRGATPPACPTRRATGRAFRDSWQKAADFG